MRRHLGSRAAGLCAADGILKAIFGRDAWIARRRGRLLRRRRLDSVSDRTRYSIKQVTETQGELWPVSTIAIL
jgi:hypothetical protein